MNLKISIIGLGYIGRALAENLVGQYEVLGTTRDCGKLANLKSVHKIEELTASSKPSKELLDSDIIVLNIPPFKGQLEWFKSWDWNFSIRIIFLSSTSVYELNKGFVNNDTAPLYKSDKAKNLINTENWIKESFSHHSVLRLGGLLGGERHPGKILAGKKDLVGGDSPINLVHQMDVVGFIAQLITSKEWLSTYNVVFPEHPSRKSFYQNFAGNLNLELPIFLAGGNDGKIVVDTELEKIYQFQHPISSSI